MDFNQAKEKLYRLLEDNPSLAIQEAKKLSDNPNLQLLKGAILIDAGAAIKSHMDVVKGVEIIEQVSSQIPDNQPILYNLANGYHALATTIVLRCPEWYKVTYHNRLKSKNTILWCG